MSAIAKFKTFPLLESSIDVAFDDMVRRAFAAPTTVAWMPAADICRDGDDLLVTLEVPGMKPGDLEIEVRERTLIVKGRREDDPPAAGEGHALRREIRRGEFSRAFRLPAHTTAENIQALYRDGMLTLRIANATPEPQVAHIPIEGLSETKTAM